MPTIPAAVREILDRLNDAGYEAYVVGGCVRDFLLGREPHDWDVATSAHPEKTRAVFAHRRVLDTGLKHGTLTILAADGQPVEVTTYRVDGPYTDSRRPDSVKFTRSLREDLARRDFTINAMAFHPREGLVDYFSGRADLEAGRICCVGDPDRRFSEDALRILRALRFASLLGFTVERMTKESLQRHIESLQAVSAERIGIEMTALLCGEGVFSVLMEYASLFAALFPELAPMVGHPQYNDYHRYDVYEHTARAVGAVPPTPVLRWTMLFHDSGKPACFTRDADGVGHFYGHPAVSVQLAADAIRRLHLDTRTLERVCTLIQYHDHRFTGALSEIKRWLGRLGEEAYFQLLEVQRADIRAQNPDRLDRLAAIDELEKQARAVLTEKDCYRLQDLKVNGQDLMALGFLPGKRLGDALQALLDAVIEGTCPNEKPELLQLAEAWGRSH